MGKIIVEGTEEELKQVTGPPGVTVSAYEDPVRPTQRKSKKTEKEDKTMGEFCPECLKKELEIKDLGKEKEELGRAVTNAATAQKSAEEKLGEAVAAAAAAAQKPPEVDVSTVLEEQLSHYLSCSDGDCGTKAIVNRVLGPKFGELRIEGGKNTIENLAKKENQPQLEEVIKAAGLELWPKKITIEVPPGAVEALKKD